MDSESGSRRTQVGQYNSETGASYGENEVVFTEGDEEVVYVVAEFGPHVTEEDLQPGAKCNIQGLDSSTPQLLFAGGKHPGKYEDVVGTLMLFKVEEGNEVHRKQTVAYKCHTLSRLNFHDVEGKNTS